MVTIWMSICTVLAFLLPGALTMPQGLAPFQPSKIARSQSPVASVVVYSQPPNPAGGLLQSSLRDPDGSDIDQWIWDSFVIPTAQDLTEVGWTGGYDPGRFGSGKRVTNFTVSIYASNAPKSEPDLSRPALVRYEVGGNAGEVAGAVSGGVQMYDYGFVFPVPFHADAATKYWLQIEAYQPGISPDWGLAKGTGDGHYFRRRAGENLFQTITGDTTFGLYAAGTTNFKLHLPSICAP